MSPLKQQTRKKQSLLNGALVLMIATIVTHVIGILYKIPINQVLGVVGRSYYSNAYSRWRGFPRPCRGLWRIIWR